MDITKSVRSDELWLWAATLAFASFSGIGCARLGRR